MDFALVTLGSFVYLNMLPWPFWPEFDALQNISHMVNMSDNTT